MFNVIYKHPEMQRELARCHPRLLKVIEVLAMLAWLVYRDVLVITRIYENDGSTHSNPKPYRFIDFAILENGGLEGTQVLRMSINALFPYDKERPEKQTIVGLNHGTAAHLHVQVNA